MPDPRAPVRLPDPGPPGPWGMREALQVLGAVIIAGPLVFALISIGILPGLDASDTTPFWAAVTVVYYGLPVVAIWLVGYRKPGGVLDALGLRATTSRWLLGGSVVGAIIAVAFNTAYSTWMTLAGLGPPEASMRVMEMLTGDVGDGPLAVFVSMMLVVAVAPLVEEAIFRGVVLSGLMRRFGPVAGIVVSSAVFAAVHLDPWRFAPLAFLGAVLGYLAWQARSIWPAVLAHALVNGLAYVIAVATTVR